LDTASSEISGWNCPSCGRRVPGRIRDCRCGFAQPGAPAFEAVDDSRERGPWRLGLPLLGLGLVLGAALALYPWRSTPSAAAAIVEAPAPPATATAALQPADGGGESADSTPAAPREEPIDVMRSVPTAPAPDAPLEDLVSRVVPAVALVQAGQNRGTGFFIARDRVLTNAHVVDGHDTVRLQVGEASYSARVTSVSTGSDLAVLQVSNPNPNQPVLTLGSVSTARVGEEVIAVGSALGVLSNTVTRGIVSALRKAGQITLIQTDAAINPGNSGGPLVNRAGQVIGINSLRAGQQAEGVAFAVAIDHATQLLNGERLTGSQTPLGNLTQILDGRSDGDQLRTRGEQEYARALDAAARGAAELDSFWTRYAPGCVASAVASGDRPWFAVFTSGGVRLGSSTTVDCAGWLDAVKTRAEAVRSDVERAAETARQRGVFPGTTRDLRRQYRLQWNGWDR
jgi:S1-C subfamily serine protease